MPVRNNETLTLKNVRLLFRNFSGAEGKFNRAGDRNFSVELDHEAAAAMAADGWNVKEPKPREGEEETDLKPHMKVKVQFETKGPPPRVVLITSRGRNDLDANMAGMLDYAEIGHVDMIVRAYNYDVQGKQGVSAYLRSIYVTIVEDELELKYADVPETDRGQKAIGTGDLVDMGEIDDPWEDPRAITA